MSRFSIISSIILFLFLSACQSDPPEIEGFDAYVWQRDKWGCSQERMNMVSALQNEKEQVMGMREAEVLRLLGKADEQELYDRNQKFLIYYLEPSEKCVNTEDVSATPGRLHIRINAMGIANEMFVRNRPQR